ncbi:helix-turn-helix transcriptional regulator [Neobacillus sp. PS2-9]|uniref:helix-turn-helix domain-containing protein n=1 Tax=Neobacillus sp. PS2-9 TaxID=3070676 RepID=UPI0027DF53F1|nr:helix-turn-helix transcriptional regulator [Neobacillus sp. PS2-9]WML57105.1 helix-turn-helix transcriptional regulator [Neobacillus sp. PS2-9]
MDEGKIIRFYREKYQLTQEQLGKGICSGTHISKIERLHTEYAPEIITLLSDRLGINIENEIAKLNNIKKRLSHWHNVLIMQLFDEMDLINYELEQEDLIQISDYIYFYKLLRVKYLLMHNLTDEAFTIIKEIQKKEHKLSVYEANLFKHVLGVYYLAKHENLKAIQVLKSINDTDYNNKEYTYYLAVAYHSIESPAMAYFFADKSRQFFKEINNYLRVIDAEMLMVIQVKDDGDFKETIQRFESLIKSCDLCNSPDRKAKVLHNLAFEYFRRKNYELANKYYKESMSLKNNESSPYLLSLEGYIRSAYYGSLLPIDELLQLVNGGLEKALKKNEQLYLILFTLLSYLLQNKEHEYYQYLFDTSLPFFKKFGFVYLIKRSQKELFNYYYKQKKNGKALKMAHVLINH